MYPEQNLNEIIEHMLASAGWIMQDMKQFNPRAALGVVVRNYPTDHGPADYVLFVNKLPFGVVETIHDMVGGISPAALNGMTSWTQEGFVLPFVYECDGKVTRFTDKRDPQPRSRDILAFHRPESMAEWIKQNTSLRRRLQGISMVMMGNASNNQVSATKVLEDGLSSARQRILVRFEAGPERTITEIMTAHRLLKSADVKRILLLCDTSKLEQQASDNFQNYRLSENNRKFSELYQITRLKEPSIEPGSRVCVGTIQTLYSLVRKESTVQDGANPSLSDLSQFNNPKDVAYNPCIPIESFDFILIDDCHPTTFTIYKTVLEYFDAFIIGFASGSDKAVEEFFK
jgi:type I restriction enzyme, R subunit